MHNLTLTVAPGRLTKTYYRDGSGDVRRRDADNVSRCNFIQVECADVESLGDGISDVVPLVNTAPIRGIVDPSRDSAAPTYRRKVDGHVDGTGTIISDPVGSAVLILDRDGFDLPAGICPLTAPRAVIEAARATLPAPFRAAACVGILSASAGMVKEPQADGSTAYRYAAPGEPQPGRARLFFIADRPITDSIWRAWLKEMGEDPTAGDPIQLQYTAAPVFEGDLHDPIPERIFHLPGEPTVHLPADIESPAQERARLDAEEEQRVAERAAAEAARKERRAHRAAHPELYAGHRVFMDWRVGFDGLGFARALGLRVGRKRGSKYPCQCPNAHLHTGGTGKGDDSSTVLIHRPDGTWQLVCLHSHCRDSVNLFALCQENPDLADEFATREWEPLPATVTRARHRRFRAASGSADASADDDVIAAVELERALAADNARVEAAEAALLSDLQDFLTRKSCAVNVATDAPAHIPSPRIPDSPGRHAAISSAHAAADHALTRGWTTPNERLSSVRRALGMCKRSIGSHFTGPNGTFRAPHLCGRRGDCPVCAEYAAETWAERVVWGGLENIHQFTGGRVVFFDIPATTTDAAAAYDELAIETDRNLKRQAARRGIPAATIYAELPGDTPDTVTATLHVCAIIPAGVAWAPADASPHAIPIAGGPPAASPGGAAVGADSPRRSPHWLAIAAVGNFCLHSRTPVGCREWLSPAAKAQAEVWLAGSGRKQWRGMRPSRAFSQLFPELPPEHVRDGEYLDTGDIDVRVASGDMTLEHRAAAADAALVGIDRRVDAAASLPAESQPVPLALWHNLHRHIVLLAAWQAAAETGDRETSEAARSEYRAAIEANRDELIRWRAGQPQPQHQNGVGLGGGSRSPSDFARSG